MDEFERILSTVETFQEQDTVAELRIKQRGESGLLGRLGRSFYYDDEDRLIIVDYEVVPADEVPEEERADRTEDDPRTGFDYYLVSAETFHRVGDDLPEDPLLDGVTESRGWVVEDSSETVRTYIPVENGEVVRQAGDMPVPVFLVYTHYNQHNDVFMDGGLWDEIMVEDEGDA